MTARHNMTPEEFVIALEALGMTPTAFAKLIGSNDKNMRRAAEDGSDGPGPAASFALRCLLAFMSIKAIRYSHASVCGNGRLAGDEFEGAFLDVEEIAERSIRGEFSKIAGHHPSKIIVDDPEGRS